MFLTATKALRLSYTFQTLCITFNQPTQSKLTAFLFHFFVNPLQVPISPQQLSNSVRPLTCPIRVKSYLTRGVFSLPMTEGSFADAYIFILNYQHLSTAWLQLQTYHIRNINNLKMSILEQCVCYHTNIKIMKIRALLAKRCYQGCLVFSTSYPRDQRLNVLSKARQQLRQTK